MAYSKTLLEHYEKPKNVGSLDKESIYPRDFHPYHGSYLLSCSCTITCTWGMGWINRRVPLHLFFLRGLYAFS